MYEWLNACFEQEESCKPRNTGQQTPDISYGTSAMFKQLGIKLFQNTRSSHNSTLLRVIFFNSSHCSSSQTAVHLTCHLLVFLCNSTIPIGFAIYSLLASEIFSE